MEEIRLDCMFFKGRRLGSRNQIVDDLKSDSNEFGRQLCNNSDFKVKIVTLILISFRLNSTEFKVD